MKSLKSLLYETIHQSKKSFEVIADETGMTASYLYRAARPSQEESDTGTGCRFPLDKYLPLLKSSENYCTLEYFNWSVGWIPGIKMPTADSSIQDIHRLTMISMREYGELITEIEKNLLDDDLSIAEREGIIREGHHVIQAISNLIENVKLRKGRK